MKGKERRRGGEGVEGRGGERRGGEGTSLPRCVRNGEKEEEEEEAKGW
jgi:hypothetical protein